MEKIRKNAMRIITSLFGVFFTGVCLYFVIGQALLPKERAEYNKCEEFQADWVWVKEDGTREAIEVPGQCDAERNEIVTIETILPETVESGMFLAFRSSKQDMKIYIDGELRQEYSTKETRLFGKNSAVLYVFLKLEDDAGKTLTVVTQTDSSYSGLFYPVLYGERMEIWGNFFTQFGAELIVAFLIFVLGFGTVIGSIILQACYHKNVDLEYLGWGVTLAAIWLIMNSIFRQVMFANISVVSDMTFCMIMLLPLPFMIYMDRIQQHQYQKAYMVGEVIVLLDFVVCTILHVMNWKDFADTILVIAIVCVLAILLMGTTILLDICKRRLKNYRMEAIGVLGASLAAVIQIIVYFQKEVQFSGTILAIGLMFLLITAVIKNLRNVVIMENEKREAILTSEAKARFLANMSHEIRTPINAVLGMDAMILRESKELPIKEYAMDIQNAGQKLLTLVNEILDLSKVESGKMEIISEEYDFGSMIHDITNMVTGKAQDKNLELNVFVEQSLPSRLLGDEVRIRQILINILNNAVKYTNEGSVRLRVSGELLDNRVLLNFAVEDTGVGIKEEDLPKLFAEFERIEEQKNRGVEGTGLGMSITSKLLRLMGSELQVRSVYGQGSVFSFELEQQIVDTTPIGNLEDRIRQQIMEYQYNVGFVAPEAKLLVVDDNRMNLKVFVNLLKDTQVQIDTADSGAECLTLVKEKRYDIIFLDHMMPEMDGIATLHCMKQLEDYPSKDAPIIALTANAISGAKEMYLAEGFDGFLSKPIIPERLEEMIQKLLPEGLVSYETKVKPPEDLKSNIGEEKPGLEQTEAVAGNKQEEADKIELLDIDGIDWSYG